MRGLECVQGRLRLSVKKRAAPREETVSAQSHQNANTVWRLLLSTVEAGNLYYDEDWGRSLQSLLLSHPFSVLIHVIHTDFVYVAHLISFLSSGC